MTKIFPISTRYIIVLIIFITSFFGSCNEVEETDNGVASAPPVITQTASTISDGKPLTEITSTNYGTNVFNYDTLSFEIQIINDEPVFVTASPSERPPINIYDSNEFLRYEDRAYAIIIFNNNLFFEEIEE